MLSSLFFRLLRFLIISIICSLPIYLGYLATISDNYILFLSCLTFLIVMSVDSYYFSFAFWETRDYFLGQLLPLVIYIIMGFSACLVFPPVVFNRIFLPLRFAGGFGMRTIESIAIVSTAVIVIVTVLRFIGARSGRLLSNYFIEEEEDL